jgi:hypothetical protein
MTQQTVDWTDGPREQQQQQQRAIKHGGLAEY